ncbi:MAG: hypothetical protein Q9225_006742, partial [Loekoesia sp. 1 TL-2023]
MDSPMRQARRRSREVGASASPPARNSRGNAPSGNPLATSRFAASRNANTQPTYDFLGGGGASPPKAQPLQQSFRQSQAVKPDLENENLRAQVKALQYEINNLKSERDFERLRHEQALQDVQERADADFKKAQ